MAHEDPLDCFTFTWKVENFSMCPQRFGESIESPTFCVDALNETKWKLTLYPRGSKDFNFVACFLESCNACEETVSYKLMLVIDGETNYKSGTARERTFTSSTNSWGWDSFISRDELFTQSDKFLMNDTLTLKCAIWKKNAATAHTDREAEKIIYRELYTNFFRDDLLHPGMKCGTNRTIINIRKKVLTWPIRNFSSLRVNRRLTMSLATPLVDVPSFFLTLYLSDAENDDKYLQVEIRRKDCYRYTQVFLKCNASVLDNLDKSKYDAEGSHLFIAGTAVENAWKLPPFITLSKLREDNYLKSTANVLKLKFEISFSFSGDKHNTEDVSIVSFAEHHANFNEPDPLINEFKSLYQRNEFTDITLQAGGRNFEAHKVILSANSPIFKSILSHNMNQLEMTIVDIPNFSPTTIEHLLSFVYTKALGNLALQDAIELYSAADKYQFSPLKVQCASILSRLLSVSNFYDVLNLADTHGDKNLRDAVQTFISLNAREILKSNEWKSYMKTSSSLAAKVMHKIILKVMCL